MRLQWRGMTEKGHGCRGEGEGREALEVERERGAGWGVREEESGASRLGLRFCYIVKCGSGLWAEPDFFRNALYLSSSVND